jgi:uncharacterized protein YndB with AHSA1/START domain
MSETVVTVEREIAAPPEQVWAMVSDVTRMGEWSPEATGARWLKDASGPEVGARFKGRNQRGWRRWSTVAQVTEAEPGKAFAFDVFAGPLKVATWSYRFETTPTGCRVEESWKDNRSGPVLKVGGLLASGVSDRETHNREGMEETLANLAEAAEAESSRSGA